MANLRANKIVSTTGSNAITGSVFFNGSSDLVVADSDDFHLNGSYTIECFINRSLAPASEVDFISIWGGSDRSFLLYINSSGRFGYAVSNDGTSVTNYGTGNTTIGAYEWHHLAVTSDGTTVRIFVNGILEQSGAAVTMFNSTRNLVIGAETSGGSYDLQGFISNLRIVKGTALYTQNFIPPTAELRNVPGTVLLCCQNPSSATQEATGKTITVNGNATARNFAPQVGSDGTVTFDGVTKISTENYFYLPTGNTEDRGRGRGLFGGGYIPGSSQNTIQFINIQSQGNSQDFGDLSSNMGSTDGKAPCAAASATRALFASGYSAPGPVNTIEYVTIATTSNSIDFGDLATNRRDLGACSSSTRALFGGGTTTGSTSATNAVDYITIASLGNAVSFGTLTQARRSVSSCSSSTRGIFGGGYVSNSPATSSNRIDYVTIATTGNATTFGDLTVVRGSTTSCSSSTRGLFAGGSIYVAPASTFYNIIDYITIASTGNATDFGDLSSTRGILGSCSNSTRGVFGGGGNPTMINTMEFVLITSTGNATDFGDLLSAALYYNGACSDSHGGLG
jgi:hypothetical protein